VALSEEGIGEGWLGHEAVASALYCCLRHQDDFAKGVIKLSDVVYYLSFIFFFLFLSLRSLESNKWRG